MSANVPGRYVALSIGSMLLGPPIGLFFVMGSAELLGFDGMAWSMPVIVFGIWLAHVVILVGVARRWRRGELELSARSPDARALASWTTIVVCGVVFTAMYLVS